MENWQSLIIILLVAAILYAIFHTRECHKYGCGGVHEPFEDSESNDWLRIGSLYSQKAGDTRQIGLEKHGEHHNQFRAVDYKKRLFVPIDTKSRELHDGQLISIKGYESANPFIVEIAKSMKFQHSMVSY